MSAALQDFAVGPLAFRLETTTGLVRSIRFRGHEVLRGIYPAVRDPNWKTITPAVADSLVQSTRGAVRVQLSASIFAGAIDLEWTAVVEAKSAGFLRYAWRGRPRRSFATNRTGLCVLHAAEAAGQACSVEHTDGTTTAACFPGKISPHQPFRNVRAITHAFTAGAEAKITFEGEVFEMEDQRNWTDASFKTYCRPLDWPRPYVLNAHEVIEHRVTLEVRGQPPTARPAKNCARLTANARRFALPRAGFELTAPFPASLRERAAVLRPKHIRVETTPAALRKTLSWAQAEAEFLGCDLHVAIQGATDRASPRALFPNRGTIQLFTAAGSCVSPDVLAAWRRAGHDRIVTGTPRNFTELNREPPSPEADHDAVTFGINAQVHAFDDASVLETLPQHCLVAAQAREIGGGRPVMVGPVILGPAADSADPRLHDDFGALWMMSSLAQLATAGGVSDATYFRAHGPGGFLHEYKLTSVELLFEDLAPAVEAHALSFEEGAPDGLDAVLLTLAGRKKELFLVNRTETEIAVEMSLFTHVLDIELPPRSMQHLGHNPR